MALDTAWGTNLLDASHKKTTIKDSSDRREWKALFVLLVQRPGNKSDIGMAELDYSNTKLQI